MTRPHRPTITVVATLWNLSCIALTYALVPLLVPISRLLPDPPFLRALPGAAIGAALVYGAPRIFPFWRTLLTAQDRNVLFAGTFIGAILGYTFGVTAAFVVLPPDFTAPVQHPPTMALLYAIVASASLLGTLLATRKITLFASAAPPDVAPATVPQA
jgi:hypothetical protein